MLIRREYVLCLTMSLWVGGNFSLADAASGDSHSTTETSVSTKYENDGWEAFQRGAFEKAVSSWLEAARSYQEAGKVNEQIEVLTYLAQAYQSLGQYKN